VGFGCDVGCMGGKFSIFADSPMGATIVDGSMWEKSNVCPLHYYSWYSVSKLNWNLNLHLFHY